MAAAPDYIPLYYLASTAAALTATVIGARSYSAKQRKRWTDEGVSAQKHTEALEANTRAASANTTAINALGTKLDGFAEETRKELTVHSAQLILHAQEIGRLKEIVSGKSGGSP